MRTLKSKRQETGELLIKSAKDSLLDECDRLAKRFDHYKLQKQGKKLRNFKKQVKEMAGTL